MSMYPSLPCIRVVEANAGIIDLVDDDNDVFIPSFNAEEIKEFEVTENLVLWTSCSKRIRSRYAERQQGGQTGQGCVKTIAKT